MDSETIMELETPFGQVTVLHLPSGLNVPFSHSTVEHIFENGVAAYVHYIVIESEKYTVGDSFKIRIGNLNKLSFYSSDENAVMYEYHDDKNCIALIGTETYYDESEQNFYTGRTFSFTEYPSELGIDYKIIHDPNDESLYESYIRTRIVWLPISDEYKAADLIDIELV